MNVESTQGTAFNLDTVENTTEVLTTSSSISVSKIMASTIATEFTLFQDFSKELRLRIWKLVCSHARDVHVSVYFQEDRPGHCSKLHIKTSKSAPALLHTNQESRAEGLRLYETWLRDEDSAESKVCINPTVDTLVLHPKPSC